MIGFLNSTFLCSKSSLNYYGCCSFSFLMYSLKCGGSGKGGSYIYSGLTMSFYFFGFGGGVKVLKVRFYLVISINFALKRPLLQQKMSLKVISLALADYNEAALSFPI